MEIDPLQLPEDAKILQQMVVDLLAQLDRECGKYSKLEALLRELIRSGLTHGDSRIATWPISRIAELLPHNWSPAQP